MSTRGTSSWNLADASASAGVSDLAALERYATSGDPRAFEILAVRYRDMVLGTCLRTLSSLADAEDATQETFLKLARHAREIRSNAAAWLHATAVRTSLDALRRRASQRRAVERSAADRVAMERTAARAESPGDEPTWRQMQPVVDAALASLSDADRSLIVERFLAGRPQADMAAEAGVSQGTMSRRIDAALERLRAELTRHGLALSLASAAGALALAPASTQASAGLAASVAKIGLSQMATAQVGLGAGAGTAVGAGAGVGVGGVLSGQGILAGICAAGLLVATAGIGVLLFPPHGRGPTGPGPAFTPVLAGAPGSPAGSGGAAAGGAPPATAAGLPRGAGFDRPAKADGTRRVLAVDTLAGEGGDLLRFDGKAVIQFPAGEKGRDQMRIESTIERCDAPGPDARLEMVVSKVVVGPGAFVGSKVGDRLSGRWEVRGRRLFLHLPPDESKNFHGGTLMALRPFKGHPADTGVKHSSAGNHELLAGNWIPMPELDLTIDGDAINMGQGDWTRESLRIISWEKTDAFARVEVICKGAADRTMIGKRFKLLARLADDGSITLTHHTLASGKNTQWPEGFDEPFISADPEGSVAPRAGLRTLLFRPGAQP